MPHRLPARLGYMALFLCPVLLASASIAEEDNHSYLPPWMLNASAAVKTGEVNEIPSGPSQDGAERTEARAAQTRKTAPVAPPVAALGFARRLFTKTFRFVTGG